MKTYFTMFFFAVLLAFPAFTETARSLRDSELALNFEYAFMKEKEFLPYQMSGEANAQLFGPSVTFYSFRQGENIALFLGESILFLNLIRYVDDGSVVGPSDYYAYVHFDTSIGLAYRIDIEDSFGFRFALGPHFDTVISYYETDSVVFVSFGLLGDFGFTLDVAPTIFVQAGARIGWDFIQFGWRYSRGSGSWMQDQLWLQAHPYLGVGLII